MTVSRRTLLSHSAAAAFSTSLPLSACSNKSADTTASVSAPSAEVETSVKTLLDQATDLLLNAYPESASSAGIDSSKYAGLKSRLTDRSPEGQAKIESDVRAMLGKMNDIDTSLLPADTALNLDVVRSVFDMGVQGFNLPYGDMALLNSNWSYRNSPYAVAQNTGAFVEIPSFLDASHKIKTAQDADAYLERLKAYAAQLDGETQRTRIEGEQGVILPDFLMEKTLGQLRGALAKAPENWGMISALNAHSDTLGDSYVKTANDIAAQNIVPAMQRQIAALEKLAPKATNEAGVWAKPDGDAYYDWALRAGTTTTLSPDEVHQMGLDELASLHARMDLSLIHISEPTRPY